MGGNRVRSGVLAVVSAVLLGLCQPAAPSAQAGLIGGVSTGVIFNNPASIFTGIKDLIKEHLIRLINGTPSGASIRIALYRLDDADLVDALADAHTRGVHVRMILDGKNAKSQSYLSLRSALGTNTAAWTWVKLCPTGGGCLRTGINHNKFWLFSQTSGSYRVLVQSSSNMGLSSYRHQWNSAYTSVSGKPSAGAPRTVYDSFGDYFAGLSARSFAPFRYSEAFGNDRTYFFPQRSPSEGDPVVNILDKVTCVDPANGSRSAIRITMFTWSRTAVADKLMQKVREGCSVSVDYTQLSSTVWTTLHPSSGTKPTLSCYVKLDSTGHPVAYIHSKYLLISGRYDGVSGRRLVLAGSPNYTGAALSSNDEAMLRTGDAYNAWLNNFNLISLYATPGRAEDQSICLGQPFAS